jgi:hypothetical protein
LVETDHASRAETWTFLPVTASIPAARHRLREFVGKSVSPDTVEVASLLVTELTTSVVLQVGSPFAVSVELHPPRLRVHVADGHPEPPALLTDRSLLGAGLVLRLMEEFTSGWGVDEGDSGKSVWFELDAVVLAQRLR